LTLLELKNLRFSYTKEPTGEFQFDLKLPAGKILAIGGRSGAGKSTLLELIAGFGKPAGGQIFIDGREITHLPPAKRQVSILFQKNNLFEHLSVLENIALGLNPNSPPDSSQTKDIMETLTTIGLAEFTDRRADTLSGGQMQRVALARELLRDTRLLLLDEPFTGLDDETRDIMLPLIKNATANGQRSVILVSHDQPGADSIIDLKGIIKNNRYQTV